MYEIIKTDIKMVLYLFYIFIIYSWIYVWSTVDDCCLLELHLHLHVKNIGLIQVSRVKKNFFPWNIPWRLVKNLTKFAL